VKTLWIFFRSHCFERLDSVILRYRRCVRPGGQVGPCRSQKTLKGTWAGQVLLFLLHVVHIQIFSSVATFEYWWSFSMHLNASLSCKSLTAHVEQQMHSKACIGPIIRWTSKIYMCHGQTEGRLLPCLGTVSILYDFPYCCICRRWTGHNISMMKHLVGSWDDHSLFKVFGPWHVCTCKSHATCSFPLVSPMLFTNFLCAWLASWWRLHMAHHVAFLRKCPTRTKCHGLSQPTMRKHYE
jgi:hypothetical protein